MSNKEKISDIEVIQLYSRGFKDKDISEIKNVSKRAVTFRRWKLGLVAHGYNSKQISPKDLISTYTKRMHQHTKLTMIKGKIATLLKRKHPELYEELWKEVTENDSRKNI